MIKAAKLYFFLIFSVFFMCFFPIKMCKGFVKEIEVNPLW
ncbi:hypothetical protein FLJC2902T_19750 [Flavobacterium limnosediminis JC2902]|uniref:Uncharacterized protein n=1 Tax=Flavobacterium limnosediminis JC2902 TaxID=1341181 RepID=V6SM10_9FLAO|nr:hypothetical protein FLJC2902T_19750 [Flavobacterium limnosediminis JC2902]